MKEFINFNMDFSKKVVINTLEKEWIDSPESQVKRIPLERSGEESGHVTSVVEYKKGAAFKEHSHPLGEEILVLEGVFSDETGDFPAGTYIRNPPGSRHSPFSKDGCKILVKLDQFNENDLERVVINTHDESLWRPGIGGLKVLPLHQYETESSALVKWPKNENFQKHAHYGGEEIFVLSGTFIDEHGSYPKWTWLRSPHLSTHHPRVDEETLIYVKTGHLLK